MDSGYFRSTTHSFTNPLYPNSSTSAYQRVRMGRNRGGQGFFLNPYAKVRSNVNRGKRRRQVNKANKSLKTARGVLSSGILRR